MHWPIELFVDQKHDREASIRLGTAEIIDIGIAIDNLSVSQINWAHLDIVPGNFKDVTGRILTYDLTGKKIMIFYPWGNPDKYREICKNL